MPPNDADCLATIELLLEDFQHTIDNVDDERIVFDKFIDQITVNAAENAQKTASDAIEIIDDAIAKALIHVSEIKAAARALKRKMRVAQAATSTPATLTTVTIRVGSQHPHVPVFDGNGTGRSSGPCFSRMSIKRIARKFGNLHISLYVLKAILGKR
ncbi:hypothetical protein L596_020623 [Steinernema carpocapsae]|uniref:Uncharacterized protein n=1 Tax=Steinernema carpocapsae TaxID=34508 RepID=A0A4U5MU36_STECR|nr:hypothetical protein L596_020623 [Steinernema carpocapsae]